MQQRQRRTSLLALCEERRGFSQDVALHRHSCQLCTQTSDLHLFGAHMRITAGTLQRSSSMRLDPVEQCLLNHTQASCCCRDALARLHKPNRLLLELQRVPPRFAFVIYPSLSQLKQLAKGSYERGCQEKKPLPAPLGWGGCLACIQPRYRLLRGGAVGVPCQLLRSEHTSS